jgi:hypothetical protein
MAWVRLDDTFPEHPKLIAAGTRAGWLWVVGLAYCARHLTDGVIQAAVVPRLVTAYAPSTRHRCTKALLRVGLWKRTTNGDYRVHDYLAYQPSRAEVLQMRQARAEAGHLGGMRSAATRRARKAPEANAQANASAFASNSPSKRSSKLQPHPLPSPEDRKEGEEDGEAPGWVAALPFPALGARWWSDLLGLFPGLDSEATARSAAAYWLDHREATRDLRGFLRRQFSTAYARHRAVPPPDPYAGWPCYWPCDCPEGFHVAPLDAPRPVCPHVSGAPA